MLKYYFEEKSNDNGDDDDDKIVLEVVTDNHASICGRQLFPSPAQKTVILSVHRLSAGDVVPESH